jgi:hypothetical protein
MAIRKNPDWSVWLADVWHWASRPPGIYICIIILLAAGWYCAAATPIKVGSYTPPHVTQTYIPPALVPAPPTVPTFTPRQQEALSFTQDQARLAAQEGCPSGSRFMQHLGRCTPVTMRNTLLQGTQNHCPIDALWSEARNSCFKLRDLNVVRIFEDNVFYLSGNPLTYVYILSGSIMMTDLTSGKDTLFTAPETIEVYGDSTTKVTGFTSEADLRIEFSFR